MKTWRGFATTALRSALLCGLILCLAPVCLHAQQAQMQSGCQNVEKERALDDLSKAEAFSLQRGTIGKEKPNLDKARQFLQRCSTATLTYAEMAAGEVYYNSADLHTAAQHYETACRMSEQIDPAEQLGDLEFNCKSILLKLLIQLDRYPDAEHLTQNLHSLASANGRDTSGVLSTLLRGKTEAVLENKLLRAQAYQQSMDVLATGAAKDALEMAKFADAAQINLFLGQYGTALKNAREAHRLLEQQPSAKQSVEALRVLYLRGASHLELGQPKEALKVFEEGNSLAPAILAGAQENPTNFSVANYFAARFFAKMAVAELLTNNVAGAQSAIANGWSAARNSKMDGLGEYIGLGRLQAQAVMNAGVQSEEAMRRAREIIVQSNDSTGAAILALTERLSSTLSASQVDALLNSAPALLAPASRENRIEIHSRLARALERAGNEDAAIQQFVSAIGLIEDGRAQSKDSEAIPAFFSRFIDIYGEAVAALYKRAKRTIQPVDPALNQFGRTYPEIGLYYSEAAHARQFSDLYGAALMNSYGDLAKVPDNIKTQERKLREELGQTSGFGSIGILESPLQTRQQSEAAARAYIDFVDGVRKQYPQYATLAFPRPVELDDLPASLDGKYIVSYMVTDDAVYWWLIFNRKIVAFDRSEVSRSKLREFVAHFIPTIDDNIPALCNALVSDPFGKIATMAPAGTPPQVIVIPDDVLYALPWEALCGLHGGSLGESFIISYAPSMTVLSQSVIATRPSDRRTAFLVGNAQEAATAIPGFNAPFNTLDKAPFDNTISALKGAGYALAVLEGQSATPEAVLARDLTPYTLVHFDTHAFAGRLEPLPSLLLHPSPESPYGLLSLTDVARLNLKARLVTLSACETALGTESDPVPGEGVEALARMFMLAGTKTVLATLWDVQDAAAGALIENFYKELGPGGAPDMATALFRAKATVRAQFKHREYWTEFILIGDPGR
jgi:CHAT domain-containing protein